MLCDAVQHAVYDETPVPASSEENASMHRQSTACRRTLNITLGLVLAGAVYGQPMRRGDSTPIALDSGARVEFHTVESKALGRPTAFSVFLPASYGKTEKTYPVLYFLHGLNNDHSSWTVTRHGNIPQLVDKLMRESTIPEMLIVHPDGDRSFYTNFKGSDLRYEDWVVEELPAHIEQEFRGSSQRNGRAIAGTSMGGYGALKIAMRFPERYQAVVAHSAIVMPVRNPFDVPEQVKTSRRFQYFIEMFQQIYGNPFDQAYYDQNNPLVLAEEKDLSGLGIFFAYGTADRYDTQLRIGTGLQKLAEVLETRGYEPKFHAYPDEPHGWALVIDHLEESLGFIAEQMSQ